MQWTTNRHTAIRAQWGKYEQPAKPFVNELVRLQDSEYDAMLSSSVCLTHLFGASANNVVVECIVRATPLVVNPLPPVVEYLGADYPLYCHVNDGRLKDLHDWLTDDLLLEAHTYLKRLRLNPEFEVQHFVRKVGEFC